MGLRLYFGAVSTNCIYGCAPPIPGTALHGPKTRLLVSADVPAYVSHVGFCALPSVRSILTVSDAPGLKVASVLPSPKTLNSVSCQPLARATLSGPVVL